jgi:hypothetical protein
VVSGAINLLLDFMLLFLSFGLVYYLDISKPQKIQLSGLLGAGVLTCVIGTLRQAWVIMLTTRNEDPFYNAYLLYVFAVLEVDISIICACVPGCKPTMEALAAKLKSGQRKPSMDMKLESTTNSI